MRAKSAIVFAVCVVLITACFGLMLSTGEGKAQSGSGGSGTSGGRGSGSDTSAGTAVSPGGAAGRSTEMSGPGLTTGRFGGQSAVQAYGGLSPGAAPGPYGSPGSAGLYGPGMAESFQQNRYGDTGARADAFNEYQQFRHTGTAAGQYRQGPVAASGPGEVASLQATGVEPGTCMWDCTASLTPTECRQLCQ